MALSPAVDFFSRSCRHNNQDQPQRHSLAPRCRRMVQFVSFNTISAISLFKKFKDTRRLAKNCPLYFCPLVGRRRHLLDLQKTFGK
jgi:hypothetical protein